MFGLSGLTGSKPNKIQGAGAVDFSKMHASIWGGPESAPKKTTNI